jgi:two-component system chemotaxis sensor kinase CheA
MSKETEFLKRLFATFKIEAAEHVATIASRLVELEKSGDAQRRAELTETVFRETHSLKGAARTVNLSTVEAVCQSIETVFSILKKKQAEPKQELFDLFHKTLDLIRKLVSIADAELETSDKNLAQTLVLELDKVAKELETHSPAFVPPQAVSEFSGAGRTVEAARVAAALDSPTIRVEKTKLDDLLLRTEGLLQAKQSVQERSFELRDVVSSLDALERRWTAARGDVRSISTFLKQAATDPKSRSVAGLSTRLMEFLDTGREQLRLLHKRLNQVEHKIDNDGRSVGAMVDGLLEGAKRVSMTPFSTLFDFLPGMVRNLLAEQGKKAELTLSGGEIEVDRRILEEMKDPLMHLVRNSVDHGIEKPRDRASVGKPPAARISVTVSHHDSGKVELVVSDDGAGIDIAKVKASAVKLGILSSRDAEGLDDERSCLLVFRSGVSTSAMVTDLSGRGLGLAIVREKAEKLGGIVSCESPEGSGTVFRMFLPLVLATIRGLLVRVEEHLFVIPSAHIRRTIRCRIEEIKHIEGRETVFLDGAAVPLIHLAGVLELAPGRKDREAPPFFSAAVLESEGKLVAFAVDEVLYEQEFLVKSLGRQLRRVRNVIGATLLGSSVVVTVLNVSDLVKSAMMADEASLSVPAPIVEGETRKTLLVVEDSVTARTLLRNILETAGYNVTTAVDGVDAYTLLKGAPFDLVISDVDMPKMNGFELTARIRSDKSLSDLPVILVTALDSRQDRERGIDVGANAYIVKSSFDQSNLLEVIKRLI